MDKFKWSVTFDQMEHCEYYIHPFSNLFMVIIHIKKRLLLVWISGHRQEKKKSSLNRWIDTFLRHDRILKFVVNAYEKCERSLGEKKNNRFLTVRNGRIVTLLVIIGPGDVVERSFSPDRFCFSGGSELLFTLLSSSLRYYCVMTIVVIIAAIGRKPTEEKRTADVPKPPVQ